MNSQESSQSRHQVRGAAGAAEARGQAPSKPASSARKTAIVGGLVCALAVTLFAALLFQVGASAQASHVDLVQGGESRTAIRLLESSDERILLDVALDGYEHEERRVEGQAYDLLSAPDWRLSKDPGAPQVPMRRILVGIPVDAQVQVHVLSAEVQEVGPYRIVPAPEIVLKGDPSDQLGPWTNPPDLKTRTVEAPDVYGVDAFYPGVMARLGDVGFLRSQRIAAVDVFPMQYNPVTQRVQFHSRFQIELELSYPAARRTAGDSGQVARQPVPESPSFDRLLQDQLVNYAEAKAWRASPVTSFEAESAAGWPLTGEAYKIAVTQDGLYLLTYNDLLSAGVPVEADTFEPRKLQIFAMGEEIAIWVVGEEDGDLGPEDYVLFYGQGIRNKYTAENVYWLIYGQAIGRRMPGRDGAPSNSSATPTLYTATLRIEKDLGYSSLWPGDDSTDRWFWQRLFAFTDTVSMTTTVDLGHVAPEDVSGTLSIVLKGYNEWPEVAPDHHAEFHVNGQYVGEHWWDGRATIERVELDFPGSYLTTGLNRLGIALPGDAGVPYDRVLLDRYELSYGHAYVADQDQLEFSHPAAGAGEYEIAGFTDSDIAVYDISDPMTVVRIISPTISLASPSYTVRFRDTELVTRTFLALTPGRWLAPASISLDAPSDLHDPANGADYVVISHGDFLTAAQRLADHRHAQGFRTVAIDVQDIYDEFGHGLSVPQAIRAFLQYAYEYWLSPAPSYVVLLGDGTYDPKDHLKLGVVNYLTPYLAFVDPWMGETAIDNWFVTVSGTDILPDLFLGRLPANSLAEAGAMVDKILLYEQLSAEGDWASHLTFVAGEQPDPDGAGNFHDLSEALIADHVPTAYEVSRVYLGTIGGSTCGTGGACKQQLINAINAGTLLVNYIGHGSVVQWDDQWVFYLAAVGQLANTDSFPVMLPMTCLEGQFTQPYPQAPSISETVVRVANRGAIASWGPTGLGVVYGHDELNRGFLESILFNGNRELGHATSAGKLRLYSAGHSLEQIQEYTLFGDPALRVHSKDRADLRIEGMVVAPEEIVPGTVLTFTFAFTNAGPDVAYGVLVTNLVEPPLINPTVVYSSPESLSQDPGTTFVWKLPELLPHSGGEIQIRAEVDPATVPPIAFFNRAEIGSVTPDFALANNRAQLGIGTRRIYLPLIWSGQ